MKLVDVGEEGRNCKQYRKRNRLKLWVREEGGKMARCGK
jgi:hypothetical protein